MTDIQYQRHLELIDAVNNTNTKLAHDYCEFYLRGYREAIAGKDSYLMGNLIMEGDMYYINQGIDRPMVGGIWLDWEES